MSDSEDFESAGEEEFQKKEEKTSKKTKTNNEEDGWDDWGEDDEINEVISTKEKSSEGTEDKPKEEPPKELQQEPQEVAMPLSSGWGWGGRMMSSLLSTASESVSTITSHVSSGISTVIESSIGNIPEPEDMARLNASEKNKESAKTQTNESQSSSNILQNPTLKNIVYGVTGIGSKVINGGLDNLEGLGKKTMNILGHDSPLVIKNNFMRIDGDKPNLSEILREAKVKSEEIEKNLKQLQKNSYKKQLHFESLFDSYYGLVHLEALEMLSKQTSLKLQSLMNPLTGKALIEIEETLTEVKELCDLGDMESIGDDEDGNYDEKALAEKIDKAYEDLGVKTDFNDILNCWTANLKWLEETEKAEPQEIYEKALRCLAETCALCITKMHKIAELLLIVEHHSTANEADSLVQLTQVFCRHLHGVANKFGNKMNTFENTDDTRSLITSIFVEVFNSSTYVQNAFQLLIPILQIGAA